MSSFTLVLAIFTITIGSVASLAPNEACWERCFFSTLVSNPENVRYREFFDEVFSIISELKYIKVLNNLTKTAFLFDSSFDPKWDPVYNPNVVKDPHQRNVTSQFYYQYMLGVVLEFALDSFNYMVQMDEESAWGCDTYQCIVPCSFTRVFRFLTPYQTSASSHCPSNIEAACSLLGNYIDRLNCSTTLRTEPLVIAIVNKDINSPVAGEPSNTDPSCPSYNRQDIKNVDETVGLYPKTKSPCRDRFHHKYAIGINRFSPKVLKNFVGNDRHYKFLEQTEFSYQALKIIYNCLNVVSPRPCCIGQSVSLATANCLKTRGPFGEQINPYPSHVSLYGLSAGGALPLPP